MTKYKVLFYLSSNSIFLPNNDILVAEKINRDLAYWRKNILKKLSDMKNKYLSVSNHCSSVESTNTSDRNGHFCTFLEQKNSNTKDRIESISSNFCGPVHVSHSDSFTPSSYMPKLSSKNIN
jgi:hypothetical protein